MKRFLPLIVLLALGLTSSFLLADNRVPEAGKLWQKITLEFPYSEWGDWDGNHNLREGGSPQAPFYRIYVNEIGLRSKKVPVYPGTIIVRENIGTDNSIKSLTVMQKIRGYNGDGGDWFWSKYSPEGKVEQAGKIIECIACHSSVREHDFIFSRQFKH